MKKLFILLAIFNFIAYSTSMSQAQFNKLNKKQQKEYIQNLELEIFEILLPASLKGKDKKSTLTELQLATTWNDANAIQRLLRQNRLRFLNNVDPKGHSALSLAIIAFLTGNDPRHSAESINLLVENGADADVLDIEGHSLLDYLTVVYCKNAYRYDLDKDDPSYENPAFFIKIIIALLRTTKNPHILDHAELLINYYNNKKLKKVFAQFAQK